MVAGSIESLQTESRAGESVPAMCACYYQLGHAYTYSEHTVTRHLTVICSMVMVRGYIKGTAGSINAIMRSAVLYYLYKRGRKAWN